MRQYFERLVSYTKKETVICLFFIVLALSLGTHLSFRNDHFQEVDSAGAYDIVYGFPASTLRFIAITYKPGSFLSQEQAQQILANETFKSVRTKYLGKFSDEFLLNQLTNSSALATFRYGATQAISMLHLPHPLQSFFAVGLGSTYSPGTGLVYGLFSGKNTSYDDFMSRSMVVSITVFHLAILLLFLINRRLGVRPIVNVFVSLAALFSISLYSSGIHVGSTVWNFATEFLWLWIVIRAARGLSRAELMEDKAFLKKISIATGVLIFFNYLILLFWAALMLTLTRFDKTFLKQVWFKIKNQKIALLGIAFSAILFVQPGQGFRGATSLSDIPSNFYYIVLNFFSWFTHSSVVNIIQFIIGCVFIICAVYCFTSSKKISPQNQALNLVRPVLLTVFALFIILVLKQTLSVTPTRHILFLTPLLFIAAAVGIEYGSSNLLTRFHTTRFQKTASIVFILIMVGAGFASISVRQKDAYDRTKQISVAADVKNVGIYDGSFNIYHQLKAKNVPVNFIDHRTFIPGETYLYVSQVEPFEFALGQWRTDYIVDVQVLDESTDITEAYFIAHNPDFETLRYSRPNNIYQTKFKVIKINKK